ncbi:hypothetical protein [Robertmurraya kyonggiensis]|nr:hypothetical protein [Robertmurraya kyonggiensis]
MKIGLTLNWGGIFSDFGNKKTEGQPGKVPEKPSELERNYYLRTLIFI